MFDISRGSSNISLQAEVQICKRDDFRSNLETEKKVQTGFVLRSHGGVNQGINQPITHVV